MAEFNPEIDHRAGAEMNALLNVWQTLEQPRKKQKIDDNTIDFNIIDPATYLPASEIERLSRDIDSRVDFTHRLSKIANRFNPNSEDGKFARARASALKAYIEEVEGRWHYSLDDYLEDTLALPKRSPVAFTTVPEHIISEQKTKVIQLVSQTGYNFDRDGWALYIKEQKLTKSEIITAYQEAEEKFSPIFMDMVGLDEKPNYSIVFDEVPGVTWVNWTRGDRNGTTLTINLHEDVIPSMVKGRPGLFMLHETGGHIYEYGAVKKGIDEGRVNPMYGITTIPGPEQWHLEGFADTIAFFEDRLYDQLDIFEKMVVELKLYESFVLRNAHIKVNEDPNLINQIQESVMDDLPNRSEIFAKRYLQQSYQSPMSRSYNAAYGATYEHWKWAKELAGEKKSIFQLWPTKDRRSELVNFFMEKPRLPMQIYEQAQLLEGVRAA